jgi:hypothetical protein
MPMVRQNILVVGACGRDCSVMENMRQKEREREK